MFFEAPIVPIVGLLVALVIIMLVRRDRLQASLGLSWLAVATGVATVTLYPKLIEDIASYFGVDYPPSLAFYIALSVVLVKLLLNDMRVSRLELKLIRCIQHNSILEAQIAQRKAAPPNQGVIVADGLAVGEPDKTADG